MHSDFFQIHLNFFLSLKKGDFNEPLRVIARVYAWREGKSFFLQLMKVPVFAVYILRGFDCTRNHRGLPQEQSRNRTFRGERRLFCLDWDCWRSEKEHVNNQWKETPFLQWLSPNTQYQNKIATGQKLFLTHTLSILIVYLIYCCFNYRSAGVENAKSYLLQDKTASKFDFIYIPVYLRKYFWHIKASKYS